VFGCKPGMRRSRYMTAYRKACAADLLSCCLMYPRLSSLSIFHSTEGARASTPCEPATKQKLSGALFLALLARIGQNATSERGKCQKSAVPSLSPLGARGDRADSERIGRRLQFCLVADKAWALDSPPLELGCRQSTDSCSSTAAAVAAAAAVLQSVHKSLLWREGRRLCKESAFGVGKVR